MPIKGAIFDMDGTLTESMHLWIEIGPRYVKNTLGVNPTEQEKKDMHGMMMEELGEYIVKNYNTSLTEEEVMAGIDKMTETGYFHEVKTKPYVKATLEKFKNAGIPMCVATATDRYLTEACLKRNGLDKYFGKIFTCREYHTTKYGPDLFLEAGKFLGTEKDETYVFEDTLSSIKGAKKANYPVIAVADRWQKHNREEIKKTADYFLNSLEEFDKLNLI